MYHLLLNQKYLQQFHRIILAIIFSNKPPSSLSIIFSISVSSSLSKKLASTLLQEKHKKTSTIIKILVKIFEDSSDELGNMRGRQMQFAVSFMGILDSHMMIFMINEDEQGDRLHSLNP